MGFAKNILFPTDLGELSDKAASNALFLSIKLQARLELLHVLRFWSDKAEQDRARTIAYNSLDRIRRHWDPDKEMPISLITRVGSPSVEIVKTTEDHFTDIVVLGTKGGSGLRDSLLGSNINHVIRHASCPILTIRDLPQSPGFNSILAPIDLESDSLNQIKHAIWLAKVYDAGICFASIVKRSAEEIDTLEDKLKHAQEAAIAEGVKSVDVLLQHTDGSPVSTQILSMAAQCNADLICIMTQRPSEVGIRRPVLGTVADRVVNQSHVATFSFPPQ